MLFAGRRADVDHVVHHDKAGEIGAGDLREGTAVIARQIGEIPAKLHGVADVERVVLDDRRKDSEAVNLSALIRHGGYVPTGATPVEPRSGWTRTRNASQAFSNSAGESDWLVRAN